VVRGGPRLIEWTGAGEWAAGGAVARVLVEASAVPPAAAAAATAMTSIALSGLTWTRPRRILWIVKPCAAGGAAEGHSAASATAASPSLDRPRSSQPGP
jgi:hypothetical protein